MIAFWISAALVSAVAAILIIQRSARAARLLAGEDAAVAVYRRQLTEIDEMAERGLLVADERRSARTEAARRLLAASEAAAPAAPAGRGGRLAIMTAAAAAPLAAIGVYLTVGSPGTPDQPFGRRLATWRAADPTSLAPDQMVAVLQTIARDRPNDPQALYYLSRAELASGDAVSAVATMQKATTLAPRQAALWAGLGETYIGRDQGQVGAEAQAAFRQAHTLDPAMAGPRYFLARAQIAGGDVDGGLAAWRALDRDLPAADPRRPGLEQDIASVAQTRQLPDAASAAAATAGGPAPFIRAMVAGLAARLDARPDDPAGWARLIRAYAVLGDAKRQAAAQARAEALFKGRPADLRLIEAAAATPQ